MSEHEKEHKSKKRKDSQLLIRINSEERDAFIQRCEELNTSAAKEIRRFIKEFMDKHA
ncbi:hypothetical protein [Litoribrevibacter albus]|uniref:Uncharacterized protein n=1 Tax=Litoribrevibacter albus TaxID=1473156 RepID=A0AA37S7U4_9GAMM|nr:hypothetical protein [Litoribrevibacter albus]GLQ29851.1 hypothetical protein GCM10007876_03290 [Litoribrevibacter albus]